MKVRVSKVVVLAVALLPVPLGPAAGPQSSRKADPRAASQSSVGIPRPQRDNISEALRLNNVGVAFMGQQRFEQALKMFEQAYIVAPGLERARFNQGIALLNLQRYEAARTLLLEVLKRHADNARAWYNLGLLYKSQGQAREALDAFQHAAQLAPEDADAHYFVGAMSSQLQHENEAIVAFQRALQLNPFHASAEFGMARAYQRLAQQGEARKHLARFQQLTQTKLGAPISLTYGDQGPLSLAEQARSQEQPVGEAIKVNFVSVAAEAGITSNFMTGPRPPDLASKAACVLDFDNDGRPDLYLGRGMLYRNLGNGKFVDVSRSAGLNRSAATACAAADYDNDGRSDLAVAIGNRVVLYRNQGDGTFKDVTQSAGITGQASIAGLTWLDYDHDGDLDLYVSVGTSDFKLAGVSAGGAEGGKNLLWRNNSNGTFTDVSAATGLNGNSPSSIAAAPTDYNNDRAVDVLVTGAVTQLLTNPREGKWSSTAMFPGGSVGQAVLDFNKDGWMDFAITYDHTPGLQLFRNVNGKEFARVDLPELHWARAWGVVAFDYDNDGWIDLAAVGETADGRGEVRLLRNEGPRGFRDLSSEVGLDKLNLKEPRAILAIDYDMDGDPDLLITQQQSGPPVLLRNDGGNQNHWLRVALKGLNDNKSAVGTKVEVFAGDLWQKWEINGAGFLGQNSADLLIGLGKRQQADVVRLLWPTGVVQDEVELAAAKTTKILEIDRRGSSCPILFAWDATRYRFVSDMIGAGVVGHWIAPGERNVADDTEYLKIEGFTPQLRNGRLSFRFMEPMEEVVYLDQVRLLAVDHPADVEVYPNEYFASNPPFPEFKVIASQGARTVRAWDETGRDLTAALRARDRHYVTGFELLPFKGFTRLHSIEVDVSEPYAGGPLRLLLYGYIEYFTATSMYAANQAGIQPVAPYVEALDPRGRWVRVLDDMGFPAGLPRTTTVDLTGKMPPGARRLRITTNLQIYWDQILVDRTPNATIWSEQGGVPSAQLSSGIPVRLTEVPLAEGRLRFHGYPRAVEGKTPGDLTYVYEQSSRTGPYVHEIGAYTRMGDVRELLTRVDDRFVVFGSGEELALEFDPSGLPALPAGWQRDYFFFADGYEKDMDFYAAEPLTVDPLPFHSMGVYPPSKPYPNDATHESYLLEYNTRFISGTQMPAYRFRYGEIEKRRSGPVRP